MFQDLCRLYVHNVLLHEKLLTPGYVTGFPENVENPIFFCDATFDALPDMAIRDSDCPLTATTIMGPRKAATRSKSAQKQNSVPDIPQEPVHSAIDAEPTPSVTELITDAIAEAPRAGQFISKVGDF